MLLNFKINYQAMEITVVTDVQKYQQNSHN